MLSPPFCFLWPLASVHRTGRALLVLGIGLGAIPALCVPLHPVYERLRPQETRALETLEQMRPEKLEIRQVVCARAEVSVHGALPARYSHGLFSRAGRAPVLLRFQEIRGTESEAEIAVMTNEQSPLPDTRLDFWFSSRERPRDNDVVDQAARELSVRAGRLSAGLRFGLEVVLGLAGRQDEDSAAPVPYQRTTYHSQLAARLGPQEAVKYRLRPCLWNPALPLDNAPETRAREMKRHLREDSVPSCFEWQAQLLNAQSMLAPTGRKVAAHEWVENARWIWPSSTAPWTTVATVTLKPGILINDQACRDFQMEPLIHSSREHAGLGSLARARKTQR